MSSSYALMPVKVSHIETLTPLIKRFTFCRPNGLAMPAFTGGSHILVKMNDTLSNAYSLTNLPQDTQHYQICVRKEEHSKGGSAYMHEALSIGDIVQISEPNNLFTLAQSEHKHLLIAGGIGITPFIPQLEELHNGQAHYELHYAFRSAEHGAFVQDLQQGTHQPHCHYYSQSEGQKLDLTTLLQQQPADTHVYVCGPQSLIDNTIELCQQLGYPDSHIHWEQFSATQPETAAAFTVTLAKSGHEITVAPNQSIIQAIETLGIEVECLCREGVCGTCETAIVAGEAEHYDQYLDDDEKAAQKTMMICVSRAKGQHITLDL